MSKQPAVQGRSPVAAQVAEFAANADAQSLPAPVREACKRLLQDVAGLIVAARNTDYVKAALASAVGGGRSTAIGHAGSMSAFDAALVNGTAAHGEDYDDTFEGGPIHAGAVIVPAVLAIAEERELSGHAVMQGIAVGVELMCRMSLVAPQATHRASFHPTAVMGAPAAAAAVAAALELPGPQIAHALGIAGSLSSGIIEYLADGSWTKRLHAGAAAQSGIRAALLAAGGFVGPATVFEGTHGFYKAFAPSRSPDFGELLGGLGERWVTASIAFKPYACGTMAQPFIDCAVAAAAILASRGIALEEIESMVCKVGEGTVHRLWEPLAGKHAPPNGYAGKFSTPYCIAVGLVDRRAGLEQFTDERVRDPRLRALAARIRYVVDPGNEYPRNYSGHLRVTLKDGSVIETEQPHLRGGAKEPLSDADIAAKFAANVHFGGGSEAMAAQLLEAVSSIADGGRVHLKMTP
jgi:2-methylcitrate dehydratase PrpD